MRVRIHFNLHKAEFTIRGIPNIKGDMRYVQSTCLSDCRFLVGQKSRDAVRDTHKRSVHAFVEGTLCDCGKADGLDVSYNPYLNDGFVIRGTQRILSSASHVAFRIVREKPITRARDAR